MSLTLSPYGKGLADAAVLAALDGGTLEVFTANHRKLVVLALGSPAFETIPEAYAVSGGTPARVRCLSSTGEIVLAGPSDGLAFDPVELVAGARVTVTGLTLASVA